MYIFTGLQRSSRRQLVATVKKKKPQIMVDSHQGTGMAINNNNNKLKRKSFLLSFAHTVVITILKTKKGKTRLHIIKNGWSYSHSAQ